MAIIQFKRGTASQWASLNPVLSVGEPAWERDTNQLKIGDGSTLWNNLPYISLKIDDPLVFKGTLGVGGTITSLPSTYEAGWSYKVITSGLYANKSCDAGDFIVSIEDRPSGGGNNNDWIVIQGNLDGSVTSSGGTENNLAKFTSPTSIGNSIISDNGSVVNIDGDITANNAVFDSVLINGISVTTTGHTHTASDITDFTAAVNKLATTVNNPGDNRILTNNGTTVGINAESNFVYDNTTGLTTIKADDLNVRLRLEQSSNTVSSHPRIELRRNRGSSSSPSELQLNDWIGAVNFTTINSGSANTIAAQIFAYTEEGLSTYDNVPTVLRFGNRMKNGEFNYLYLLDDGTLNPRNGAVINDDSVAVRWTGDRAEAVQIFTSSADSPLVDNQVQNGLLTWVFANVKSDSKSNTAIGSTALAHMTIPSNTTLNNDSAMYGQIIGSYRNAFLGYSDNGTLPSLVGCGIAYGHLPRVAGTDPQTNTATGLSIYAWAGEGNIQTAYDILLGSVQRTQRLDEEGTTITGDGTISTRYGIVQIDNNPNVLAGSLRVDNGLSAPKGIHNLGSVSGNTFISYDTNKQVQTLSLNGSQINFIEGSNWPSSKSVEVLLEITVTNTTTAIWSIVDDWYTAIPSLTVGKHLVLLRNIGLTMQGLYLGKKTN